MDRSAFPYTDGPKQLRAPSGGEGDGVAGTSFQRRRGKATHGAETHTSMDGEGVLDVFGNKRKPRGEGGTSPPSVIRKQGRLPRCCSLRWWWVRGKRRDIWSLSMRAKGNARGEAMGLGRTLERGNAFAHCAGPPARMHQRRPHAGSNYSTLDGACIGRRETPRRERAGGGE
ncbi:hypothetical protein MTO96_040785 [Rhipicephalus appendiculatus]